MGKLSSWCKLYEEGDENIRKFIIENQISHGRYEGNKLTITSKFTEADAIFLPSLLDNLGELEFVNTKFEGESLPILCESLKKSEKVS